MTWNLRKKTNNSEIKRLRRKEWEISEQLIRNYWMGALETLKLESELRNVRMQISKVSD